MAKLAKDDLAVRLELTREEARWLLGVTQNAFIQTPEAFEQETKEDAKMRLEIFNSLDEIRSIL